MNALVSVYVYASGMVASTGSITPVVSFTKSPGKLTVVKGDLTYAWSNINATFQNTSGGNPYYPTLKPGMMKPGDVISIGTTWVGTLTIAAGDHLIGTWNYP